jgi:hypothetical protein
MGTLQTAQEGAVRIIRRAQVRDPVACVRPFLATCPAKVRFPSVTETRSATLICCAAVTRTVSKALSLSAAQFLALA